MRVLLTPAASLLIGMITQNVGYMTGVVNVFDGLALRSLKSSDNVCKSQVSAPHLSLVFALLYFHATNLSINDFSYFSAEQLA